MGKFAEPSQVIVATIKLPYIAQPIFHVSFQLHANSRMANPLVALISKKKHVNVHTTKQEKVHNSLYLFYIQLHQSFVSFVIKIHEDLLYYSLPPFEFTNSWIRTFLHFLNTNKEK